MRSMLLMAIVVSCVVGCGGGDTPPPADNNDATSSAKAPHPAGKAAEQFMNAVVKGDIDTATNLLTPRAIDQFASQGKRFAPPGLGTATFRIGDVVQPNGGSQAIVQCLLVDKNQPADSAQEEICCMMRLVENQWRVSAIAYDSGTSADPAILDFENLPPVTPQQGGAQISSGPGAPTDPPRAAMQPGQPPLQ